MSKILYIVIFIIFAFSQLFAVEYSDTIYCRAGDTARYIFNQDQMVLKKGKNDISGRIILKPNTIAYPLSLEIVSNDRLIPQVLDRTDDTSCTFHVIKYDLDDENAKLQLTILALAGSDTTCDMEFTDLKSDDISQSQFNILFKNDLIGPHNPYIRFAKLLPIAPNPINPNKTSLWTFKIDLKSTVQLYLYNIIGEKELLKDYGLIDPGIYNYEFFPGIKYLSGMYYLFLDTSSGDDYQPFIIEN